MDARRLIGAILVAALVAGCGDTTGPPALTATASPPPTGAPTALPTPTPAPTASPSPTATPSPTPATLTIAQAAKAYLAIAKAYNKAAAAADKKYGSTLTLKSQKALWAALAKADAAFIAGFKKIAFPPEVASKATAVLNAMVVLQRRDLLASRSTSIVALNANAASANRAGETSADKAAILRDALGLPSN